MDQALLVNVDIDVGDKIVDILDKAGLKVSVALWVHLADYGDWRLCLASRELDAAGPLGGYGLVHDALDAAGVSVYQTPTLLILKMTDPFIRSLRRMFRKTKSTKGMRLGGQTIGDRFVEDAFVYRIS